LGIFACGVFPGTETGCIAGAEQAASRAIRTAIVNILVFILLPFSLLASAAHPRAFRLEDKRLQPENFTGIHSRPRDPDLIQRNL
jgi:hypothetical protein